MDMSVGVLGGGQLGRMLVNEANLMGVRVNVLDAAGSPAMQVTAHPGHVEGSFKEAKAIGEVARRSDVVTVEIEHVDADVLAALEKEGVNVQPHARTIRTIQDKFAQKKFLHDNDVATAESIALDEPTVATLRSVAAKLGLPLMLKSRREAYDGRGNYAVRSEDDFEPALKALERGFAGGLYAEKWAAFRSELAVMVVKTVDDILTYPTVETIHENSICKLVYAPARGISTRVAEQAQALARKAVAGLWGKGVFAVEMFLLEDERLLVNEMAPRPHNSGHYTIDVCTTSQFRAHLHAILDLPIHREDLQPCMPSIMLNILGQDSPGFINGIVSRANGRLGTRVHLYGKGASRKGRKMGHLTVRAKTMAAAERTIAPLIAYDRGEKVSHHDLPDATATTPTVAVVMGSDSDLPVLQPGLALLSRFQIPYTVRITSAHRTPSWMAEYATGAAQAGIQAIIAAAGGAAHLPGMAAAHTTLPVIGVPVKPSIGDGTDSLLSIVNMPRGVPVATVGVNNSVNAALLAARILALADQDVRARVEEYVRDSEAEVRRKDRRLVDLGHEEYARAVLGK